MRAADPRARIGLSIDPDSAQFGNAVLKGAAGSYDFVAGHYYSFGDLYSRPFEEVALGDNFRIFNRIERTNALIRAYNPGREVYQLDTEWGLHGPNPGGKVPDWERRNANIYGVLHRAVRLIYYSRENLLRGASSWQMLSRAEAPGFGILPDAAPGKRFMLFWLYSLFNRLTGPDLLPIRGTAPFYSSPNASLSDATISGPLTPVLATRSRDKKTIFVMIANGSWSKTIPCRLRLRGPKSADNGAMPGASGVQLSNSDPDADPLLSTKDDLVSTFPVAIVGNEVRCSIAPHSVVFLSLQLPPQLQAKRRK